MRLALVSKYYEAQVDLLLEVLPVVAKHRNFAIKGGTALNLFYLDMPRLSVDIDLCYLPVKDRKESFGEIHAMLKDIKDELEKILGYSVQPTKPLNGEKEARLTVSCNNVVIKIEPNYILRGCLFEPVERTVVVAAEEKFKKSASALVVSVHDLYGGKFCAALDRQHPRELFDVFNYFKSNTITADTKDSFLFYLLSHNRPMHELLDAHDLPIVGVFEKEFRGMSREDISISQLESARTALKAKMLASFDDRDRELLLSFSRNEPDWNCYRYAKIKDYPSIRWKLYNLAKTDKKKRDKQSEKLAEILCI